MYQSSTNRKLKKEVHQGVLINEAIKAPNIMIIDENGKNLGIFPRNQALTMKDEYGLDLVQLSYDKEKMLSTVKMIDYGKYMYAKAKEEKEKKRKQKVKEMKEIKIKYSIGENDLRLKIQKGIEMLRNGHGVKCSIKLKGREKIHAEKAKQKLLFIANQLQAYGKLNSLEPKEDAGGGYSIMIFTK